MSILAARLSEAMAQKGIDQSMLARRVGVTQGAISKIIRGKSAKSRLIPRIAAELAVPMAWLTGEGDSLVEGLTISIEDRELLDTLHQLGPDYRAALLNLSRAIVEMARSGR